MGGSGTPEDPYTSQLPSKRGLALCLAIVLLVGGCFAYGATSERGDFRQMTCAELTSTMLEMTGTSATEPYDVDRVKMINQTRREKGCPA